MSVELAQAASAGHFEMYIRISQMCSRSVLQDRTSLIDLPVEAAVAARRHMEGDGLIEFTIHGEVHHTALDPLVERESTIL